MRVQSAIAIVLLSVVSACASNAGGGAPLATHTLTTSRIVSAAGSRAVGPALNGFETVPVPLDFSQYNSSSYKLFGGTDGNVWITDISDGVIGYINPTTRQYHNASPLNTIYGHALRQDPGGAMYIEAGGGFVSATTSGYSSIVTNGFNGPNGYDFAPVSGGGVYYNGGINASTLFYASPSAPQGRRLPLPRPGSVLGGPTLGSDGNIYFVDRHFSTIGRYNPTTQAYDTDSIALSGGGYNGAQLYTAPDGNLFVCGSHWYELNLKTLKLAPITDVAFNCPSPTDATTVGSDGAFWFGAGSYILQRIDGTTHQYSSYRFGNFIDPNYTGVYTVASGSDGNIWAYWVAGELEVFHMQTAASVPASLYGTVDAKTSISLSEKNYTGSFGVTPDSRAECGSSDIFFTRTSKTTFSVVGTSRGSGINLATCTAVFIDDNGMARVYVPVTIF